MRILRAVLGQARLRPRMVVAMATFLSLIMLPVAAFAATSLSQGYTASEELSVGSIASLKEDSSDEVVAATTSNADNIIGIVINQDSSQIAISNGAKTQVQVATNGVVPVLVSDIAGEIKQGDPITASPITGVGMKAIVNTKVVGFAQGKISGSTKQTIKDSNGDSQEVNVGQAPVLISVSYHYKTPEKTVIPAAVQNVADAIAGRKVGSVPIIVSGIIFIIMLVTVVSIIYSMIRSGIISIGRNPMSQSAVYRDIVQLSVLVIVIISVSITAIYIVLTRL